MYKFIIFLLFPLFVFSQYNPIDTNVKALWYYGGNLTMTNDSIDVWSDLSSSGLNPAQATVDKKPKLLRWDGIDFDGTDDYLSIGSINDSIRPGTGDFSIEGKMYSAAWVSPDNPYSLYSSANSRFVVYISTSNRLGIYVSQASGQVVAAALSPNNALVNGSTHTFTISVDRTTDDSIRIYIDGVKVASPYISDGGAYDFTVGTNLYFGSQTSSAGFFDGKIYCFRYSDKARTAAEALAFHNWASDTSHYFIDPDNGSDENNGASVVTPLASFDSLHTAGITLNANDNVYLKTGTTLRQQLTVPSSGTSGNPITLSAYDSAATPRYGSDITGADPMIKGSDVMAGWTDLGGGKYRKIINGVPVRQVFFNDTLGTLAASSAAVDATHEWFYVNNGATDSLFIFATDTTLIEAAQRGRGILGEGKDYITVDNIEFKHSNYYGISMTDDCDNWIVQNCDISYIRDFGIQLGISAQCSNMLIQNNTISYCGESGIQLGAYTDACTVSTNTVSYCGTDATETSQSGIKLWGESTATCNNNIVEYNNVSYCGTGGTGISDQKGVGIWIDQCFNTVGNGNIVRYNNVHDNNGPGIYIEKTSHNLVYYNLVNNNMLDSEGYVANLSIEGNTSSQRADSNYVLNNVVYTANGIALQVRTFDTGTTTGNIMRNNIAIHTGGGYILSCVAGGANNVTAGTGNIYNSNCFGAEYAGFTRWGGVDRDTYDAFIAASSQTDNNVESDPLFKNAGTDFELQAPSPCINAGTSVGLTSDYRGRFVPLGSAPDIGAYEMFTGGKPGYPGWPMWPRWPVWP